MEWIRFILTAVCLGIAVFSFATAVLGTFRFGFIMNRIHSAGIGDTAALFFVVLASVIGSGELMTILKLVLVLVFMWCTSPVSTHFLGQIEYYMDRTLDQNVEREDQHESN
ncbi:MAG: monovalent cation/H(+) antiporter subunit G [Eubacterium sp.]|nr:monovalent cation/H(+) antiporter subunit G [Eubacterium sp.]